MLMFYFCFKHSLKNWIRNNTGCPIMLSFRNIYITFIKTQSYIVRSTLYFSNIFNKFWSKVNTDGYYFLSYEGPYIFSFQGSYKTFHLKLIYLLLFKSSLKKLYQGRCDITHIVLSRILSSFSFKGWYFFISNIFKVQDILWNVSFRLFHAYFTIVSLCKLQKNVQDTLFEPFHEISKFWKSIFRIFSMVKDFSIEFVFMLY